MIKLPRSSPRPRDAVVLVFLLATGCSALHPTTVEQPAFYTLDYVHAESRMNDTASTASPTRKLPTLIVNPPRAASGFASQRIVYVREPHQLEYYAHSEWVDSPARIIAPLIVSAIGDTGTFAAAVLTPSGVMGDLRLDTEIVRLQNDLSGGPDSVRFTLRATLSDNSTRMVLARRSFDESAVSASGTPSGAVLAANQVVQRVLEQLARFCAETAAGWQPDKPEK